MDRVERFQELVGFWFVHGRINNPGSDRIEPNALASEFNGKSCRDGIQASFREDGDGGRHSGNGLVSQRGRNVHDMTCSLLPHLSNNMLCNIEKAREVG